MISIRCVIGLPTILTLGGLIDLVTWTFVYSELDRAFSLTLDPPGKGLPERIVFDNSTLTIPQGVATNIRPTPSLLHYTFTEDRALSSSSKRYSDSIIVYGKLFRGNVSRELECVPR